MNKKRKQILSIILALIMTLGIIPFSGTATVFATNSIDTSALEDVMGKFEALSEDDYTAESWTFALEAFNEATKALTEATIQDEVDTAASALNAAIDNLQCIHRSTHLEGNAQAKCTVDGYTGDSVCDNCGETVSTGTVIPALGHNWSRWTITAYPQGATPGSQERKCRACKEEDVITVTSDGFYLVNFYNYDKARLVAPVFYARGTAAQRPEETPFRAEDVGYTYTFSGWNVSDAELNYVRSNIAAVAQYTAHEKTYKVTFKDGYGKAIKTADVPYTQIGNYSALTLPTKPSDGTYKYKFVSWNVEYDMNTNTAVATPNFSASFIKQPTPQPQKPKDGIFTWLIEWIKDFFMDLFGF